MLVPEATALEDVMFEHRLPNIPVRFLGIFVVLSSLFPSPTSAETLDRSDLTDVQRQLVQGLFAVAARPVSQWMVPIARVVGVREHAAVRDVLRLARRQRLTHVPVCRQGPGGQWFGYVKVAELARQSLGESRIGADARPGAIRGVGGNARRHARKVARY